MEHLVRVAAAAVLFALTISPTLAQDRETYTLYHCRYDRSYCTTEQRPVLTPAEAARADALGSGTIVEYSPASEAKKKQNLSASGYRDPSAQPLCPPPRHMTQDGCR